MELRMFSSGCSSNLRNQGVPLTAADGGDSKPADQPGRCACQATDRAWAWNSHAANRRAPCFICGQISSRLPTPGAQPVVVWRQTASKLHTRTDGTTWYVSDVPPSIENLISDHVALFSRWRQRCGTTMRSMDALGSTSKFWI